MPSPRSGTIEVGEWAELVIRDADPLGDMGARKSTTGHLP
jgi:imidazolonepropionase-like amidohydrolase